MLILGRWKGRLILGHWKGRLIDGISLAEDNIIKDRLIDGISLETVTAKANSKTLGTMARATWMRNLVDTWTLEGQTYRWDKSGKR